MNVKTAHFSKLYPTKIIVTAVDGQRYWTNLVPARVLSDADLQPLPSAYYSTADNEILPEAARSLYQLHYTT